MLTRNKVSFPTCKLRSGFRINGRWSVQLDLVSAVRAGDGGGSTGVAAAALPAEERLAEVAYL